MDEDRNTLEDSEEFCLILKGHPHGWSLLSESIALKLICIYFVYMICTVQAADIVPENDLKVKALHL